MRDDTTDHLILMAQMAAEDSSFSFKNLFSHHLPLLAILAIGIILTLGGIATTEHWEDEISTNYLRGTEKIYSRAVQSKLETLRRRARMTHAFFIASQQVDPEEFETFSRSLFDTGDDSGFVIIAAPNNKFDQPLKPLFPAYPTIPADTPQNELLSHPAVSQLLAQAANGESNTFLFPTTDYDVNIEISSRQYIVYGLAFQKSAEPPIVILSATKASAILNNPEIYHAIIHDNHSHTSPQTSDSNGMINFENISLHFNTTANNPILRRAALFKWALAAFSILFTFLLALQYIYAKRSVSKMAALAAQRASDLSAINSDLTEEIMNRIRFQAELLERSAEIQEANRKLEDAQNQLVQQEKLASLGQLAAGVAHEINNPIGFINSNLTMLEKYSNRLKQLLDVYDESEPDMPQSIQERLAEAKKTSKYKSLMDNINAIISESKDGVERVKRIVQDLKNFSRVDEAEWQWANLHDGIDSTLNIAWNEIKYKATVEKHYGNIPLVECVPSQINQVFMNLLVNAAQAMKEPGEIHIHTRQEGEYVIIEVADTGCGIPPDIIKRIFDPFFTTKEVGKGTGLGLSLSYGIIKKHSGDLTVKSVVGQGSTFTVKLPIKQPEKRTEA